MENICQKYDQFEDKTNDNQEDASRDQLLHKMKEKMKLLVDQQFNVDYEILMNNVKATEIENKLNNFASHVEIEKFRLFVDEFDSVNCLIRNDSHNI